MNGADMKSPYFAAPSSTYTSFWDVRYLDGNGVPQTLEWHGSRRRARLAANALNTARRVQLGVRS